MDEVSTTDPSITGTVPFNFQRRELEIARRKEVLAALMKRAMEQERAAAEDPLGHMVSGRYVRKGTLGLAVPQIQKLLNNRDINKQRLDLEQSQNEYADQDRRASIEHIMSRPQAQPELAGPPAEGGSPELFGKPISKKDLSAWAAKGSVIPSRRAVLTKLIEDIEVQEPIRESARSEKRLDREDRQSEATQARRDKEAEAERARIERGEEKEADRVSRSADIRYAADVGAGSRRATIEAAADKAAAKEAATAANPKTTESERSNAGYLNRMRQAEQLLSGIKGGDLSLTQKLIGAVPGVGKDVQPYVMNSAQQKALQAQRDWVRAKLRKESGASIGDAEMAEEVRTYFAQPGEGPKVAAQKAAARKEAERQLEIGSGAALPQAHPSGASKRVKFGDM